MAADCDLCAADLNIFEYHLEDRFEGDEGHTDWLAVRRALEEEHDIETTVTHLKRHMRDHVTFTFGGIE